MIRHALHEQQYLNVHKYYKQIYDSESIQQDETKWKEVFTHQVVCSLVTERILGATKCGPICGSIALRQWAIWSLAQNIPGSKTRANPIISVSWWNVTYYFAATYKSSRELTKCFVTPELMRWPKITEVYGSTLESTSVFNKSTDDGNKRWQELHHRIIEHNIRVVAKYYTRITTKRLMQLLDLNERVCFAADFFFLRV